MEKNRPNSPARVRLYLPSVHASITGEDVLNDSMLAALAVEDICWSVARDDWISRQPSRWHWRKLRRWQAEYQALCKERDEIRIRAGHCGLPGS